MGEQRRATRRAWQHSSIRSDARNAAEIGRPDRLQHRQAVRARARRALGSRALPRQALWCCSPRGRPLTCSSLCSLLAGFTCATPVSWMMLMDSTCWPRHACARGARGEREGSARGSLVGCTPGSWLRRRPHMQGPWRVAGWAGEIPFFTGQLYQHVNCLRPTAHNLRMS